MKRASQLCLLSLCVLVLTTVNTRGQPAPGTAKAKEYIDQEVERHRWEINVNAGSIFKLATWGTYQYYYLIKLNSKKAKNNKGKAWRFALSPQFGRFRQFISGDTSSLGPPYRQDYSISPQIVLGHEWQRLYGRTMLYGGIDLFAKLSRTRATADNVESPWESGVLGNQVSIFYNDKVWLSPFLGAKLYVNHRISLSVEGHTQFGYGGDGNRVWFEKRTISRQFHSWTQIDPQSCYFIGVSYNF